MEFALGYLLGLFIAAMTLCTTLHKEDLEAGLNRCQNNGGLEKYISNVVGDPEVVCRDGAVFTLKDKE